ncbi:MAG: hypothetical protein ACRD9R_21615 [Pyrinomonadaceae bacterium]
MKFTEKVSGLLLLLASCAAASVAHAQTAPATAAQGTNETRVALAEAAQASDAGGRVALEARLRTTQLPGTPDAPVRNTLIVFTNRSPLFYNYVSGWATFYDAAGVRCGEGLWKLEAFAPNESAEVDTPGLRLTCTPSTWRVAALNLLTSTADVAKPDQPTLPADASAPTAVPSSQTASSTGATTTTTQRLEININGRTLPLQLGNAVEIVVGQERVRIVVSPAP